MRRKQSHRVVSTRLTACALFLVVCVFSCTPAENNEAPAPTEASPLSVDEVIFEADDYSKFKVSGSGSLEGKAYVVGRKGRTVLQTSNPVLLIPRTKYTQRWFREYVVEGGSCPSGLSPQYGLRDAYLVDPRQCVLPYLAALDERIQQYIKVSTPTPNGGFRFSNLPPGDYLLATMITYWEEREERVQGGIAHAEVALSENEHVIRNVTRFME